MKAVDLTGQKFSKLLVLSRAGIKKSGNLKWLCLCDCGASLVTVGSRLLSGETKSCGCLKKEPAMHANLPGQRFGRLIVLSKAEAYVDGRSKWLCQCDCGKQKVIGLKALRSGNTQSCGCLASEKSSERRLTHGHTRHHQPSSTYLSWHSMRQRCLNPNDPDYSRYGGRGIIVCERWEDFQNFLTDMGERPEGLTLERIENDGNYSPDNCIWATRKQQANNRQDAWIARRGKPKAG